MREEDIPTAKVAINRALAMAPDSAEVLFEAGYIAKAAGENAQARDYWTEALTADPNGPAGKAAREALAMSDAPLTVTNQVAKQPYGDGEGQGPALAGVDVVIDGRHHADLLEGRAGAAGFAFIDRCRRRAGQPKNSPGWRS